MVRIEKALAKAMMAGALVTMIGSGAALAQGAPPGSSSWKVARTNSATSAQARAKCGGALLAQGAPPGSSSWKAA